MPPRGGRVTKQVQTATRASSRSKTLAMRLQKQKGVERAQSNEENESSDEVDEPLSRHEVDVCEKNRDAIAKLSDVPLSEEQHRLREKVLQFCRESLRSFPQSQKPSVFLIQGDAGTGKSVVLNALFNELQRRSQTREDPESSRGGKKDSDDKKTDGVGPENDDILTGTENYLVVNHPEMLKLYHRISAQFPYIRKTDLERPTSLINRLQKEKPRGRSAAGLADVILVDEAHLLLSKKNAYKRFFNDNQLDELLKLGKVLVVVFDSKQSLRFDAFWDDAKLEEYLSDERAISVVRHQLGEQFRVVAAPDMQRWIHALSVEGQVLPRPRIDAERRAAGDTGAFDFRIYDDAGELYRALMQRNDECGGGCRLLSTYDWPYRLPKPGQGGASQKVWYVDCGNFRIPWDKYLPQIREPWSEQPDSYRYCGSVYTIQGFDLTYAGVILGPSIGYDADTDKVVIRTERYEDHAAFMGRKNDESALADKERIVLNSVNVLLTRGVHGLYLYAYDPALRKRLLNC